MLTSPIANREQLAEAIVQAKTDPTGKSKWYVMRVAKAMRLESDLPPEWKIDAEKISAVRRTSEPHERTVAETLAHETAAAVDSASPGDDVIGMAASASVRAMRDGAHDEFIRNFGAALDELVSRDRLYSDDAAAIVAAARKVASAEGMRRYNKPIGTPLGSGAASSVSKSAASVATLHGMPNSTKAGTKIVNKNPDGTTSSHTLLHTEDDGDAIVLHASDSSGVIHKTRVPKNARVDVQSEASNSSKWKSQSEQLNARKEALRKRMQAKKSGSVTASAVDIDGALTAGVRKVASAEGVRRYDLPIGTPLDGTHAAKSATQSVARIGDDKNDTPKKVSLKPGESVYLTGPNKGKVIPKGGSDPLPSAEPAPKRAPRPDRPKNWTAAYSPGSRMHKIDTEVAERLAKELESTGYLSDHTEEMRLKQLDKLHGTNRYAEAKARHAAKKAAAAKPDAKPDTKPVATPVNNDSGSKTAPRFKEQDVIDDYVAAVKKNRKLREEGGSITQAQRARAEIDDLQKYMRENNIEVPQVPRENTPVAGTDKKSSNTSVPKDDNSDNTAESAPAVHKWRDFSDDGDPRVDDIKIGDVMYDEQMNNRRKVVGITEEKNYRGFTVENEHGGTGQVRLKRAPKPMTDQEVLDKHKEVSDQIARMEASGRANTRMVDAKRRRDELDKEIEKRGIATSAKNATPTSESSTKPDTKPDTKSGDSDLIDVSSDTTVERISSKSVTYTAPNKDVDFSSMSDSELQAHAEKARKDLQTATDAAETARKNHKNLTPRELGAAFGKLGETSRASKLADEEIAKRKTAAGASKPADSKPADSKPADSKPSEAAAASTSASAPTTFVTGKQKSLGTVNMNAKGKDPERFQPKTTLGDGHEQKVGDRVVHADGRTGVIEQTYQTHTAVKWDDDGRKQTVVNTKLNSNGDSSSAAPQPNSTSTESAAKSESKPAAKSEPKSKSADDQNSSEFSMSNMSLNQIDDLIGDLTAKRNSTNSKLLKAALDRRIETARELKKTLTSQAAKSKQKTREDIDDQIGNLRTLRRKVKTAGERSVIDNQIFKLQLQRRSGKA